MPRRRRNSYQPEPTKPAIFWLPDKNKWALRCKHNDSFVTRLEFLGAGSGNVPTYLGAEKIWLIDADCIDELKQTVFTYFGEFDFIDRPDRKAYQAAQQKHIAGQNPYKVLFINSPLDAVKKLYKAAVLANHPDRGGSHETMSEINTSWLEIKKELNL